MMLLLKSKSGFLSGPIERGFLSGPLDAALLSPAPLPLAVWEAPSLRTAGASLTAAAASTISLARSSRAPRNFRSRRILARLTPPQPWPHVAEILTEVCRIRNEHADDPAAISKDRVKGSLKVTRAFGAGFLKQEGMDKTDGLPGSESPNFPEDRVNGKQPYLSPLSPIEDEGAQLSIQSFRKGQGANIANCHTLYTGKMIVLLDYVKFLLRLVLNF